MPRKAETITLSCAVGVKEKLEQLAIDFDLKWGDKPNISKLLNAIGNGDLILSYPNEFISEGYNKAQIEAIKKAIMYFTEVGDFVTVKNLVSLIADNMV